jgi:hypothetical protein
VAVANHNERRADHAENLSEVMGMAALCVPESSVQEMVGTRPIHAVKRLSYIHNRECS